MIHRDDREVFVIELRIVWLIVVPDRLFLEVKVMHVDEYDVVDNLDNNRVNKHHKSKWLLLRDDRDKKSMLVLMN